MIKNINAQEQIALTKGKARPTTSEHVRLFNFIYFSPVSRLSSGTAQTIRVAELPFRKTAPQVNQTLVG